MAALAFAPEEFDVGVNIFGVTNWLRTLKSIPPYWESFRESLYAELGNPFSGDSTTALYNISPLFHAKNVTKLLGKDNDSVFKLNQRNSISGFKSHGCINIVFMDEGGGFVEKRK